MRFIPCTVFSPYVNEWNIMRCSWRWFMAKTFLLRWIGIGDAARCKRCAIRTVGCGTYGAAPRALTWTREEQLRKEARATICGAVPHYDFLCSPLSVAWVASPVERGTLRYGQRPCAEDYSQRALRMRRRWTLSYVPALWVCGFKADNASIPVCMRWKSLALGKLSINALRSLRSEQRRHAITGWVRHHPFTLPALRGTELLGLARTSLRLATHPPGIQAC